MTSCCCAPPPQVAGETIDEATLSQVLLAVLDQPDDPKAAQTQGVAISEVEAASHYIVQRFGKSARKVAEQALREVSMSSLCVNFVQLCWSDCMRNAGMLQAAATTNQH